jgi:hypothetical protein
MKVFAFVLVLLLTSCQALGAVDLRMGAGGEVIPWSQGDGVGEHGFGAAARADIVWSSFTSTSVDLGWRRWSYDVAGDAIAYWTGIEIMRFGLIQRAYLQLGRIKPYLGGGLLFQKYRVTSDVYESEGYHDWNPGLALLLGGEIPITTSRFAVDGSARLELDLLGADRTAAFLCIGLQLVWTVFR